MKGEDYDQLDQYPVQTLRIVGNPTDACDAQYPIKALIGALNIALMTAG